MDTDVLLDAAAGARTRHFLLHLFEMLVVMMIGMCALGGAARGLYAVISGSSFVLRDHVTLAALVMGIDMALPMALWMRFRGHSWERGGEMAAAMLVPSVLALAPYGAGAVSAGAVLGLAMILMLPAMVAVMLYRKEEYSAPHPHRRRGRLSAQAH